MMKLWLLCPPSKSGALLQGLCGDDDSERGFSDLVQYLRGLSSRAKAQIRYGVLDDSNTLYLPYAWCHAVLTWTDAKASQVCSMWYVELEMDEGRLAELRRKAQQRARCGMRRQDALRQDN